MRPYTLTYLNPDTDITEHVISIDKFTDSDVFYKINSAQIMLTTLAGRFLTKSYSGDTPILRHLDQFKLEFKKGSKTYSRILFLDSLLPQESGNGNQIQLELFGREKHLESIIIPGHWFFITVKNLVRVIIDYYNINRGTNQPEIEYDLDFPDFPLGTFDFGSGINVIDALRQAIAWLQLPVSASGAGTIFSMVFEDNPNNGKLTLKIFPQGEATDTIDTITSHIDHAKVTRVYERYAANLVVLRGQQGSGSMPPNHSEWTGRTEEYDNIPVWRNDISYSPQYHTQWEGSVYVCLEQTPIGVDPNSTEHWLIVTKDEYIGTEFQYSPWTKEKANLYLNTSMSPNNPFDTDFTSPAFVDSNLVIRDAHTWQDECIMIINSINDIPDEYLYPTTTNESKESRVYEGMKFLIGESPQTPFINNDKYGRPYADSLVQMDEDGDWLVIKNPERGDHVAVRREGKIYEYQYDVVNNPFYSTRRLTSGTELTWKDASGTFRSNHCFHFPRMVENVPGLIRSIGGTHEVDSAIKTTYRYDNTEAFFSIFRKLFSGELPTPENFADAFLSPTFTKKTYYNLGWWFTLFETPFPTSTYYPQSEKVGKLFGGDNATKVPVLDANNLNYTPTGKQGFNASDSDSLGVLDGLQFRFNFDVRTLVDTRRPFQGNVPFRCTIYDTEGNVWIRDFTYRFLGLTEDVVLLFSEFQIYRARAPNEWFPTLENITTPELLTVEIPERRKIKRITIQMQGVYDEHGRYDPLRYLNFFEQVFVILGSGFALTHEGTVDGFSFIKSPLGIAKDSQVDTHHVMKPIQEFSNISNVEQLKKIARAQLALSLHPNDVITVEMPFSISKEPGESFYLDHKYMIETHEKPDPDDPTGVIPNTRELSVVSVNYSDNGDVSGAKQQIEGIKRI